MSFYPVAHTILPRLGYLPQGEFQGWCRRWGHIFYTILPKLFLLDCPSLARIPHLLKIKQHLPDGVCLELLSQSPQSKRTAHPEPTEKPVVQPVEQQNLEDPQPPSSESKLDLQPEPTVKFLFTLLSSVEPPEPKEPQEDLEILESRFLDKEDWGTQQTLKEINHLQNDCMRLRESLSTIQADNVALREKLQNLPNLLYTVLTEELKVVPAEGKAAQEEEQDVQEEEQAGQETGRSQGGQAAPWQVVRGPHLSPLASNNPASRRQPCSPCSLMLPMTTETNVSLQQPEARDGHLLRKPLQQQ